MNTLNRAANKLVGLLLESKTPKAQEIDTISEVLLNRLLDKSGELNDFGLWQAVEISLPRKLTSLLARCADGSISGEEIDNAFPEHNRVLRLVDRRSKELTDFARVKAIQGMGIEQQCSFLGIGFEILQFPISSIRVEEIVAEHYRSAGFRSMNLEGGDFNVLMKCAAWEEPQKMWKNNTNYGLELMVNDWKLGYQRDPKAVKKFLKGINNSKLKKVIQNFEEIYPGTALEEKFPGLTAEYISGLYKALGRESLLKLAHTFIRDSNRYLNGWPDVTCYSSIEDDDMNKNGSPIFLREVKVDDKLLVSQIIALRTLQAILKDISVVKVKLNSHG